MTDKNYILTRYYSHRISECGHQPVFKKILPDGEPIELSPTPSQKLNNQPGGFQWGYCGSGPAQLALALLLDATTNPFIASAYYQQFKWDKVAEWGYEWNITNSEILEWVVAQERRELGVRLSKN